MTLRTDVQDVLGDLVRADPDSPRQRIAVDGLILRTEVGSTVHGTAIAGQDDLDEMGVCLEGPETVLGHRQFQHYTYRTQPEGVCSGAGDLDLTIYSARKFCYLAAKGNATVLLPLWVPEDKIRYQDAGGASLRALRSAFVSQLAGKAFRGYLHSQREGLMGLRSGGTRNQGRADIRARYGFDTKFAMHMVRIGIQGVALLETGEIPTPVPEPDLTWLRELRAGEHTKDEALERAADLEARIDALLAAETVPPVPDYAAIDEWLIAAHLAEWDWRGRR